MVELLLNAASMILVAPFFVVGLATVVILSALFGALVIAGAAKVLVIVFPGLAAWENKGGRSDLPSAEDMKRMRPPPPAPMRPAKDGTLKKVQSGWTS